MKIFLALFLSANLFAATALNKSGAYKINRANKLFSDLRVGTLMSGGQWLKGQYSYSVSGGTAGLISLKDDEGQAVKLPSGAIIYDCVIDVLTAPTHVGGGTVGEIAIQSAAAGDLKVATATSSYTTASRIACTPTGTAASSIKMASETTLKIRSSSDLAGGKINVWVSYVVSE